MFYLRPPRPEKPRKESPSHMVAPRSKRERYPQAYVDKQLEHVPVVGFFSPFRNAGELAGVFPPPSRNLSRISMAFINESLLPRRAHSNTHCYWWTQCMAKKSVRGVSTLHPSLVGSSPASRSARYGGTLWERLQHLKFSGGSGAPLRDHEAYKSTESLLRPPAIPMYAPLHQFVADVNKRPMTGHVVDLYPKIIGLQVRNNNWPNRPKIERKSCDFFLSEPAREHNTYLLKGLHLLGSDYRYCPVDCPFEKDRPFSPYSPGSEYVGGYVKRLRDFTQTSTKLGSHLEPVWGYWKHPILLSAVVKALKDFNKILFSSGTKELSLRTIYEFVSARPPSTAAQEYTFERIRDFEVRFTHCFLFKRLDRLHGLLLKPYWRSARRVPQGVRRRFVKLVYDSIFIMGPTLGLSKGNRNPWCTTDFLEEVASSDSFFFDRPREDDRISEKECWSGFTGLKRLATHSISQHSARVRTGSQLELLFGMTRVTPGYPFQIARKELLRTWLDWLEEDFPGGPSSIGAEGVYLRPDTEPYFDQFRGFVDGLPSTAEVEQFKIGQRKDSDELWLRLLRNHLAHQASLKHLGVRLHFLLLCFDFLPEMFLDFLIFVCIKTRYLSWGEFKYLWGSLTASILTLVRAGLKKFVRRYAVIQSQVRIEIRSSYNFQVSSLTSQLLAKKVRKFLGKEGKSCKFQMYVKQDDSVGCGLVVLVGRDRLVIDFRLDGFLSTLQEKGIAFKPSWA